MAMKSVCGICDALLERDDVTAIRMVPGTSLVNEGHTARFLPSDASLDVITCARCAAFFSACIDVLVNSNVTAQQ